jgi:hypothetical protein
MKGVYFRGLGGLREGLWGLNFINPQPQKAGYRVAYSD